MHAWEKGLVQTICSIAVLSHYHVLVWHYRKSILDVYYMLFLAGVYFSREIRISCFRIDNYSVQVVYVHRNSKFLSFMFGPKAVCVCGGGGPEHWNPKKHGLRWVRAGFKCELWYVPALRALISSCVNANSTYLMGLKEKKNIAKYLSHYAMHIYIASQQKLVWLFWADTNIL